MKNLHFIAIIILVFVLAGYNLPGSGGGHSASLSPEQLVQRVLAQTAEA